MNIVVNIFATDTFCHQIGNFFMSGNKEYLGKRQTSKGENIYERATVKGS